MNIRWLIILFLITSFSLFLYSQNKWISVTHFTHSSPSIPEAFHGFKILHLSDFHNTSFGQDNKQLMSKVSDSNPDIIFITGDTIDRRRPNIERALQFLRDMEEIAPVYMVLGNHEGWSNKLPEFLEGIDKTSVTLLRNDSRPLEIEGESIVIAGIDDPSLLKPEFSKKHWRKQTYKTSIDPILSNLDPELFTVLLSHRPESFKSLAKYDFDLMLSGHAHGGQIRLPFIGGLFSPNQGFFPEFTEGKHTVNNQTLIISRGLGNSIFPFRVFNRPEIIIIELDSN